MGSSSDGHKKTGVISTGNDKDTHSNRFSMLTGSLKFLEGKMDTAAGDSLV